MPNIMKLRTTLMALLCLLGAGFWTAAVADVPKHIDVPAGDLIAALEKISRQANVELVFRPEQLKGLRTKGVSGTLSSQDAVRKLLEGTSLQLRTDASTGAMMIGPAAAGEAGAPAAARGQDAGAHNGDDGWIRLVAAQSVSAEDPQSVNAAPPPGQTGQAEEEEEMVVTGSRVRTSRSASSSPIIVLTDEDLRRQGLTTIEDIMRILPQNFTMMNEASTQDNSITSTDMLGMAAADLRGLGPQNTLILVNGRRRATSASDSPFSPQGWVNINTIPVGSIERVEIITDGASAIYGSDAVAGVINFILKKDYQGARTTIRQDAPANGGARFNFDQMLGMNWSSGNATLTGRYSTTEGVDSRKAGYTTSDFRPLGGSDRRSLATGQPGVVTLPAISGVRPSQVLGQLAPGSDGTSGPGVGGSLLSNAPGDRTPADSAEFTAAATNEQVQTAINLNIEQSLGSMFTVYGDLSYVRNENESTDGPPRVNNVQVPTTNRFNNYGEALTVSYVFIDEWRNGLISDIYGANSQESWDGTLGTTVSLPRDWEADVSFTRSQEYSTGRRSRSTLTAVVNQRAAGLDANGAPLPPEMHLNLFGNGTAQNPAALEGLLGPDPDIDLNPRKSINDTVLFSVDGPLLRLPGGSMRLAAGGEFRDASTNYNNNRGGIATQRPSRETLAFFTELAVPVVGQANRLPGVHSLDVFLAARREEISIYGPFDGLSQPNRESFFKRTSPRYGITYYPIDGLKLRGSFGKSFAAPSLISLFGTVQENPNAGFSSFPIVSDPLNPGVVYFTSVFTGGNPDLGPETSDNLSLGVDWTPGGWLQGLSLSLTYGKIEFENRVASTQLEFILDQPTLFAMPIPIVRDPGTNLITSLRLIPVNSSARTSETIDLSATYDMAFGPAYLTFGVTATEILKLEDQLTPISPIRQLAGLQTGPAELVWRSWVTWSMPNYGVSLYANHSSAYINTGGVAGRDPVDSYLTFDLTGTLRLDAKGWQFNAGVRNLFDADFPFFNGFNRPWDPRRVDTHGRTGYLEISKEFSLFR